MHIFPHWHGTGWNSLSKAGHVAKEIVALDSGAVNHFVPRIITSVLLGEEQPVGHIFSREWGGMAQEPQVLKSGRPVLKSSF